MDIKHSTFTILPKEPLAISLLLAKQLQNSLQRLGATVTIANSDYHQFGIFVVIGHQQQMDKANTIYLNYQTLDNQLFDDLDYLTEILTPKNHHNQPVNQDKPLNIVAVTACPTGVAHTFMSAEAIENYAKAKGWQIKVETRGQVGAGNIITPEEVAAADLVFV